jgi:hypothetical protein
LRRTGGASTISTAKTRERRHQERAAEREAEREYKREQARERRESERRDAEFAQVLARAESHQRRESDAAQKRQESPSATPAKPDSVAVNLVGVNPREREILAQLEATRAELASTLGKLARAERDASEVVTLRRKLEAAERTLTEISAKESAAREEAAHQKRLFSEALSISKEATALCSQIRTELTETRTKLENRLATVTTERDLAQKHERWIRKVTGYDTLPIAPPGKQFTYMPAEFVSEIDYPEDPRLRSH